MAPETKRVPLNPAPSVASAAIADGQPAISSSFRFHRPRGPLCGRGYCFQCELASRNGGGLACQTPHDDRPGRPRRDALRPLGRLAEQFPPWFYERRFLHPRQLRGLSLHVLRHLSSAASLHWDGGRPVSTAYSEREVDVVVVGSGSAEGDAYRVDLADGRLAFGLYPDRTLGVLGPEGLVAVAFNRLVLATGGYERLPPIPGNDLPGVIGLRALQIYANAGSLRPSTRIAAWAPPGAQEEVRRTVARHDVSIVWMSERAPEAIVGKRRVTAIVSDGTIECDLFVIGVSQPAIELALQGGATAELTGEALPILAVTSAPDWMTLSGAAAARTSGVPDVPSRDDAFACLCEDVRVRDVRACVQEGFTHPELVKRRTGAMTGPCQGKLCSAAVLSAIRDLGGSPQPIRARPLARPATIGELAADA